MKNHNKIVIQALNDYLRVEKPGYGILIKGDWGCGKSFFVKQWKETIKKNITDENGADDEVINLKPIYVSLNGISSVMQIDDALKRAISPYLHGKFMKGLGKALKLAASVALRVNVDMVGDNQPEQVVCTIDPKSLLEFDPTKVRGQRILIFDDIERAKLSVEEILGYINYFVEHVGCHVVIVGDVRNVKDENTFKIIKEKTIGHEYSIETETEDALAGFIKEIDKEGRLKLEDVMQLISYTFSVSRVNNLRILRQSLYDYKMFVSHLPEDMTKAEEFKSIKVYLLVNFITVYAEYKSGNLVMEKYQSQLVTETVSQMGRNEGDKTPAPEKPATDTRSKYQRSGLTESHRVLSQGYVESVMSYLLEGSINYEFLWEEVRRDRSTPWEKLAQYNTLTNNEFVECLNHTVGYLENGEFECIDIMLMATCSILTVIKKGMTSNYTVDKILELCKVLIEEKYFPACKTLDELYQLREHAHRCLGYYKGDSILEECNELSKIIEGAFVRISPNVKNTLTVMLDTLTDDKIKQLIKVYLQAIPDHSVTYSSHPIFSQVDPEKFVNGFVGLNNESKVEFIHFVKRHYHQAFYSSNAKNYVHYYEEDLNKLPEIVSRLKDAAEQECLVNKENIMILAETLTQSGDTIQILAYKRDHEKSRG